jgi:hypothetical protein
MNEVQAADRIGSSPGRSPVEVAADVPAAADVAATPDVAAAADVAAAPDVAAARKCAAAISRDSSKVAKKIEGREAARADRMAADRTAADRTAEVKTTIANRAEAAADAEATHKCGNVTSRDGLKVAKRIEDRVAVRDKGKDKDAETALRCGAIASRRDGMKAANRIEDREANRDAEAARRCGGIATTTANHAATMAADAEAAHRCRIERITAVLKAARKAAPMTGVTTMITITRSPAAPMIGTKVKVYRCGNGTRTIEAGGRTTKIMMMIIASRAVAAAGVALQR